jgi:hypothetical protein
MLHDQEELALWQRLLEESEHSDTVLNLWEKRLRIQADLLKSARVLRTFRTEIIEVSEAPTLRCESPAAWRSRIEIARQLGVHEQAVESFVTQGWVQVRDAGERELFAVTEAFYDQLN